MSVNGRKGTLHPLKPLEIREDVAPHRIEDYGLDAFFHCRVLESGEIVGGQQRPSDYWDRDGITCPGDKKVVQMRGRPSYLYPVMSLETKLPDTTDGGWVWFGFENDLDVGTVRVAFKYGTTSEALKACVGGNQMGGMEADISDQLPSNYKTEKNNYVVTLHRHFAEFFINKEPVAYALLNPEITDIAGSPPYALGAFQYPAGRRVEPFLESAADERGTDLTFPIDWTRGKAGEGEPNPARSFPFYEQGAETIMAGSTYDAEVISHPVPSFGFKDKTILFQADTDSTTDGFKVEVYTLAGHWRTYDQMTTTAGELETYILSSQALAIRVRYDPASTGATINDLSFTGR